jgi:ribosomal-protein-alanine N-acetyltransferase
LWQLDGEVNAGLPERGERRLGMRVASIIETPRLTLRRARMDDAPALHAIMSDRETMRFWSTLPHEHIETTAGFLMDMIAAPAEESDDYIVEHAGRVIGKLGGWRLPEVGFLFAREALEGFVAHRAPLGSKYLTADVDPRNARSLGLLKRVGFTETSRAVSTWLVGETWCDSVYLRLEMAKTQAVLF